jgi:hypothetical protein
MTWTYRRWLASVCYYISSGLKQNGRLYRSTGRAGLRSPLTRFGACFILSVGTMYTALYILLSKGRKVPPSIHPRHGAWLVKFFYTKEYQWAKAIREWVRHCSSNVPSAEPFGVTTNLSLTSISSVSVTDMGRTLVLTVTPTGTRTR